MVITVGRFSGDHPEDVKVLGTVRQGRFNLHAVVIGVGEDAVLRKFVQAEGNKACFNCRGAAKFIQNLCKPRAIKLAFIAEAQPNLSTRTLSKTPSSVLPGWINLAAPQQIEQVRLPSACTSFPFIVSIIKKSVGLHKGKPAD